MQSFTYDREYKKGAEFCKYNMTCINPECNNLNMFGLESRKKIKDKKKKNKTKNTASSRD
jgi:hypothetical protein